jgi:SAM-dependent methyltransferase
VNKDIIFKGNRCKGNKNRFGPSSFFIQDPTIIFDKMNLQEGQIFLDLGCGAGDYAIEASKIIGNEGIVYAFDISEMIINNFTIRHKAMGIENIKSTAVDITGILPIKDNHIDICFMSTVLHTINLEEKKDMFKEVNRVLKQKGKLIIIECKKDNQSFGPPMHVRISPDEMKSIVSQYGFDKIDFVDLGFNYMMIFDSLM